MPGPATREIFGNIGRERDTLPSLQRLDQVPERLDPALLVVAAIVRAGAADRPDAQPLSGDRVHLAVAMTRDQDFHLVLGPAEERQHEVMPVPHRDDDRPILTDPLVDIRRLDDKTIGSEHQAEVFGRQHSHRLLKRKRVHQPLQQIHRNIRPP